MRLIIGNIIALIASFVMVYTGYVKKKNKIIIFQSIYLGLLALSNLVLGGYVGFIVDVLCFVRNIIYYYDKLGLKEKIVITILSIVLSLLYNNLGIIGYCPLIATITYLWLIDIKDIIKFKIMFLITTALWIFNDVYIKSYIAAIFDILTVTTTFISIIELKKKGEKNEIK